MQYRVLRCRKVTDRTRGHGGCRVVNVGALFCLQAPFARRILGRASPQSAAFVCAERTMRLHLVHPLCFILLVHCDAAKSHAPRAENGVPPPAAAVSVAPGAVATGPSALAIRGTTYETYEERVARIRAGDRNVDFRELRVAYLRSASYPKSKRDVDELSVLEKEMLAAVKKGDAETIIARCDAFIERDFIDLGAHRLLKHAHKQLGHRDLAEFHRFVELGLLSSITAGHDGKSPATAWHVVRIKEEYFILRMLGAEPQLQRLQFIDGHNYDVMETIDEKTKQNATYYFNIDIHIEALAGRLSPGTNL
ncbi:DUF4919 domain-containing protein [Pendulispora albinea]|uniref:DUF4919 domain-containing protein n=1 Tax=Pendulispora albinea TaxID=2741071 RepID=A0ABZ2M1B3_9BACT